MERPCPSRCRPQHGNSLTAKQFVGLDNFVDRRTPIKHRQEMTSSDGSALHDNILRDVIWRASDELIVAKREPAGGRWRVGYVRAEAFVLGHKALQAIGHALCIEA